ncbi:MAG TPA: DUF4142 domain-containing protein [Terracidiphilus sp.]|nr:DUF4142 domain-containing protein [Terracidiphilus sp.]
MSLLNLKKNLRQNLQKPSSCRRGTQFAIALLPAVMIWAAAPAVAQQPGGMPAGGQQQMQQQPPGVGTSPGMGPSPGMPGAAGNEQAYRDAVFVQDALRNSQAQVAMSQLAATKSPSQDVQQFSQKMVQLHTSLSNQLKPATKALGVDEPKGPSKKERQEIARLEGLSGPDFDTAYLTDLAKEQQKNLRAFRDEENNAQSPGLQQAAKQDEPVLSQHYEILQKLAQAHNVTISEAKK